MNDFKFKKIGIPFAFAFILITLICSTAYALSDSGGGNWKYQCEIVIQENSGKTLTDYQLIIELDGDDFPIEAQSDGADIRFTDEIGEELNYWMEEFDSSNKNAKIWVKVPKLPANKEAKITMWYGNPSAESVSEGDTVFDFFDGFSGTALDANKWNEDAVNNIDNSINNCFRFKGSYGSGSHPHPYWIYDGTDTGSQHQVKWVLPNSFVIEWNSKISSQGASENGEGGVAVIAPDNTIIYYLAHIDPSSKAVDLRRYVYSEEGAKYGLNINNGDEAKFAIIKDGDIYIAKIDDLEVDTSISSTQASKIALTTGIAYPPYLDYIQINDLRVRKYASSEPTTTLEEPKSSALSIKKSATPYSIRQFQDSTITISLENSGTSDITNIEVMDSIHPSFNLINGDFPNPKRYDLIRPGETRDFQYIISAKESGTFTFDLATVTYADEGGNIQEVLSEPISIKVIPSTEGSISGISHNPSVSTASVHLHGEKTDVVMGEDILLKLAAVNLIGNPTMHVQVIITPPSGMSVTSSEFVQSGAGIYTTTYELEPEKGRDIEVRIKSNQIGDFNVQGRIIYYFGDNLETKEDHTLTQPIKVRENVAAEGQTVGTDSEESKKTPGFCVLLAFCAISIVWYYRNRM